MKRLRLAISREEIEAIAGHLDWAGPGEIAPEYLRILYESIPDRYRHKGPIYRGLSIDSKDVTKLLSNQGFKPEDRSRVESWTAEFNTAVNFADAALSKQMRWLSVILRSTVEKMQNRIVMDLTGKAGEYVLDEIRSFIDYDLVDDDIIDEEEEDEAYSVHPDVEEFEGYHSTVHSYLREQEVVLETDPTHTYRYCDDVFFILTQNFGVFDDKFLKEEHQRESKRLLLEKMDEKSRGKFERMLETDGLPHKTLFRCQNEVLSIDILNYVITMSVSL